MMTVPRRALHLLWLAICLPLLTAAGGGPDLLCVISGTKSLSPDTSGLPEQPGGSGLGGWRIRAYPRPPFLGALLDEATTDVDGHYEILSSATVCVAGLLICEVLEPGWTQTLPSAATNNVASCDGVDPAASLGPLGYIAIPTLDENERIYRAVGNNFGNSADQAVVVVEGVKFHDLNRNASLDSSEPGVPNWSIHVFGTTATGATLHRSLMTDADGHYRFLLGPGHYTICEERQREGWVQTAPTMAAASDGLADCSAHSPVSVPDRLGPPTSVELEPVGYTITIAEGTGGQHADFGNVSRAIKGSAFDDVNGNGVRELGEPGRAGRTIYLLAESTSFSPPKPEPGPVVQAHWRVDRHARRRPGEPVDDICTQITGGRCSTPNGGRVSLVLSQGSRKVEAVFHVALDFQLGCVPTGVPPLGVSEENELGGAMLAILGGADQYIPISEYGLPRAGVLAGLFSKLGIKVDPHTYFPVIKAITSRSCQPDPNPANNIGVFNPGILVVDGEIGFASKVDKEVVQSTTTGPGGEYRFGDLRPGSYTVCEAAEPGVSQTVPLAGVSVVDCGGSPVSLAAFGYQVVLSDPAEVATRDFGTVQWTSVSALTDVQLWLGLVNSEDQGTRFDVRVELLKNGTPIASGLRRCVPDLTRNPVLAREIHIAWDLTGAVPSTTDDRLALKVSTRVGTNPDGTLCGGHGSARGVRLYYDGASRPSQFAATLTPASSHALYLRSNGTTCPAGGGQSFATAQTLTSTTPLGTDPKCRDSGAVTFGGGNAFREVGTWVLQ